ncbi:MAG: branched-chain amino acid ABC transporter permease [Dehalococcoidia bacterium]|nr:branched-chain amino acid ABC transporter permease [Dehalococcoidia bacterium]
MEFYLQLLINGLLLSLTYILFALGLTLIFGIMDIVNFAHGDFFMLGAFGAYFFYGAFKINYFLALLVSMALVGVLGILAEKTLFYRLRREVVLSFIIALGLSMILQSGTQMVFGVPDQYVLPPYQTVFRAFGVSVPMRTLLPALIGGALAVGLVLFMRYVKQGRMLRAVAMDMDASALQGISIARARALAWFLGCVLAGAAGVLLAPMGAINASIGQAPLVKAFGIVIIGGLGSVPGAILGGLLLGLVESFGSAYIDASGPTMIWFGLVILMLIVRPQGLLGHA